MEGFDYQKEVLQRALLPPPRVRPQPELGPIIEPPFRGVARPKTEQPEEWEAFRGLPVRDDFRVLTAELTGRARALAVSEQRVAKMLADKRYITIGASLRESKEAQIRTEILVVIYNYTDNEVVEVLLNGDNLEVSRVNTARYQPAPVEEEVERAIRLARDAEGLAKHLTEDLVGMVIQVTSDDPADPRYNHRLFDVRFGCADERLPRFAAIVDLSTGTVVRTGVVDQHCGGGRHG
ncbi:MAG: hypothetical protein L0215_02580 [Gemmataceae bacterium]|nr:hypothetical protein [Gemmataceae bacterium]